MTGSLLSTDEIRRKVNALGPWFHNLDLHGVGGGGGPVLSL
jgi:tRNA (mo5U34)-methyltransferase